MDPLFSLAWNIPTDTLDNFDATPRFSHRTSIDAINTGNLYLFPPVEPELEMTYTSNAEVWIPYRVPNQHFQQAHINVFG
jgi:hypothetical protein